MSNIFVFCAVLAGITASQVFGQTSWENPVRKLLKEGKPVIGATITAASPEVAAQAAGMGFDFIWIEMEHSPITLETARNMILATRGLKALPFIRVPVNELWTAKRAMDIGAIGVVFPFTSTPELARQAVASMKYPPAGRRGSGPALGTFRWPAPEGYADFIDKNGLVIVIIEEVSAVEKIEEIAATPGIDVLFIGANDLSYSLGLRGNQDHPKHREAMAKIIAAAKKNGLPVGRPVANAAQIREGIAQGFTFFQGPSDMVMLRTGAEGLLKPFGKWAADGKDRPTY
jgi:2-keto-3-deoxy-L-rhamnonate aldolase RhmA